MSRDELVHEARKAMLKMVRTMKEGICDHPDAEQIMMNQLPVRQCKHCGGEDIRVSWQSNALVTFKRNGLLGNRIKFLICGKCGAILYQCVAEPHRFPQAR